MTTAPIRRRQSAFRVRGLTAHPGNLDGRTPDTARIGALWERFFGDEVYASTPHRTADARLFGVYSACAGQAHGAYDVTTGVAVSHGEGSVPVEAGDYLVFHAQGQMPVMVVDAWQRIGQYFEAHPEIVRRYRSDFEAYEGPGKVAIHIGVA